MLRKTSILTALYLLTSPCFSGFYLGAAIGPEGAMFTRKAHFVNINANVVDTDHFAGVGGFGSLFAGYGRQVCNRFYLAGEINANLSSVEYVVTNDESIHANFTKATFTIKNSEGISLLPGIFLAENTLFYGRLGYANGRVNININDFDPTINNSFSNRSGFRYGLGVRHCLSARWTAMMDYSQINYQGVDSHVFDSNPNNSFVKDTGIRPYTAQVAFGLLYNFDAPVVEEVGLEKD